YLCGLEELFCEDPGADSLKVVVVRDLNAHGCGRRECCDELSQWEASQSRKCAFDKCFAYEIDFASEGSVTQLDIGGAVNELLGKASEVFAHAHEVQR